MIEQLIERVMVEVKNIPLYCKLIDILIYDNALNYQVGEDLLDSHQKSGKKYFNLKIIKIVQKLFLGHKEILTPKSTVCVLTSSEPLGEMTGEEKLNF